MGKDNDISVEHYISLFRQKVQERWYEKLHEWEKAFEAYNSKREQCPDDMNYLLGEMRCLEALGEW